MSTRGLYRFRTECEACLACRGAHLLSRKMIPGPARAIPPGSPCPTESRAPSSASTRRSSPRRTLQHDPSAARALNVTTSACDAWSLPCSSPPPTGGLVSALRWTGHRDRAGGGDCPVQPRGYTSDRRGAPPATSRAPSGRVHPRGRCGLRRTPVGRQYVDRSDAHAQPQHSARGPRGTDHGDRTRPAGSRGAGSPTSSPPADAATGSRSCGRGGRPGQTGRRERKPRSSHPEYNHTRGAAGSRHDGRVAGRRR